MKKNILWLGILSILSLTATVSAQAITRDEVKARRDEMRTELKADQEQRKTERVEKREETREQKCAMIQERIQNRIGNFDGGKEMHMAVYKNMVERISKFIEKLSAEGYDVSKIESDLETLKGKIDKFSADKDARLALLKETKEFACGKADGEFRAKLVEARKALQLVHSDAIDIRKYMLNTVRPDIQALRKQKIETKKSGDDATEKPELE